MESMLQLNLDRIYTLIYKKEPPYFRFHNPGREWDGFVLFTEGTASFSDASHRETLCTPGTVLLLRQGHPYEIFSLQGCAYVTSAFDFSPGCSWELNRLPTVAECPQSLITDMRSLEKVWQLQRWDSLIRCRIGLLEFYAELLRCLVQPGQEQADPAVRDAVAYIHRNFRRNFSAEEIAAHCGISAPYLRARFRSCMNSTVTDYRNTLRINAAKQMLQSGLFSVKETAEDLGYCDVYYFSKCFTRATGISPGQFASQPSRHQSHRGNTEP